MARPDTPITSVRTLGELQPGILQHPVQPIHFLRAIFDLPFAIPRQVAQIANRRRRHQAAAQQPAFEQLRQPLAVAHVRLAARDVGEMLHVDQQHRERRPPTGSTAAANTRPVLSIATCVTPCACSHSRSTSRSAVIVPNVCVMTARPPLRGGHADGRHHRALVHVDAGTSLNQRLHHIAPSAARRSVADTDSARRASGQQ